MTILKDEGCPKFGDASGAAVGTAVAGPIGTVVGSIIPVGSIFHTGSPRYEGGPLLSSVQNRLSQLQQGNAQAVAQTRADAVTGGPGWKDVALVLAPVVRPDLFGTPSRALTSDDFQALGPFATMASATPGTQPGSTRTPGVNTASLLGGTSPTLLLLAGGGLFLASKLLGGGARRRRR